MTAPTISTDALPWLIRLLGPDAAACMARPLTDQEAADVEEALARHGGDPVAALGVNVDPDTATIMRNLPVGIVR